MTLHLRPVTDEERAKIARLTRAQTAPVRLAARARIIELTDSGLAVPAIAAHLEISEKCARQWVTRFNQRGLEGLDDAPRVGRPRTYDQEVYGRVIAKAQELPPKPSEGETPPTGHWTLDRLQAELAQDGVSIKRSQIRRILRAEHLKWQRPRTWLESPDPQFAQKGGPRSALHRPAARQYGDLS